MPDDAFVVEALRARAHEGRYWMFPMRVRNFRRVVRLPVPVRADASKANYNGRVLKIELTNAMPARRVQMSRKYDGGNFHPDLN